ncbi:MAG: hypothetical protein ACJZ68_02805, partial [Limisphaerales bacterium]
MAKAKAFITRHPAWTTIFIVLFAGLFMGAKWLEPQPDVMDGAQFSTVQRGNLRVTVAEGGALDSTSKLNLKCELDNGGTIVSLVAEGTYVDGPSQYQVNGEDTLQSITEKHMYLANVPTADKPAGKAEQRAFEEALRTANPDLDWENLGLGQTVQIPGALLVKFEDADLRDKILHQEKAVADAERDLGNAKKDLALRRIETASANRQAALDVEFSQQDLDRYIEGDTPLQLLKMEGDIALAEEEIKRAEEKLASTRKLREKGYATSLEVQSNELTIKKQQNSITQTK